MGCSFAGSRGEMTLTKCFQDDRRLHHAIPQVPQGLPERGASAGSFFNAGEGLGARLLCPNDLTQYLFEKEVVAKNRQIHPIYFGQTAVKRAGEMSAAED